ncbi:hypothetical protein Tco_1176539 [Tanacetum coccineum]
MCPKECKIVGQLLVDHALSCALTATADVPAMYLQQFWKTIKHDPNQNHTIRFIVDKQEITYTVDMFRSTLKLPVETPEQPFIEHASLEYIQPFQDRRLSRFKSVPKRLEEEYHSIKVETPFGKYTNLHQLELGSKQLFKERTNHRILTEEDSTRIMTELILPNNDDVMNIELSREFLMELQSNAYHGMFDEDVVDHIAKVLETLDLIKILYIDSHQLRMKVFPLLLADDARQW